MTTNHLSMADTRPFVYYLDEFWSDIQDPRTNNLFLANLRPVTFSLLISSYIIFSTKLGPYLMANRQPFSLRTPMLIYNIFMVFVNFYFFIQVVLHLDWGRRFLETKFPDRTDTSPVTMNMLSIAYFYWWSKFADLLDTVFFVLRKKQSHISFLHIYHHSAVPTMAYIMFKVNVIMPGSFLFALLNTIVHTVMYSYYALSSLGPGIQKYLWWKKYLTQLQLIQFAIFGLYSVIMMCFQENYPPVLLYIFLPQPLFFFYMFYDFYNRQYKAKKHLN